MSVYLPKGIKPPKIGVAVILRRRMPLMTGVIVSRALMYVFPNAILDQPGPIRG